MEEDIWQKIEQSTNKDTSTTTKTQSKIYIGKNHVCELSYYDVRNFINTHRLSDIKSETLYQYFGDNVYYPSKTEDLELYLPHMICYLSYVPFEKLAKALEASFEFINPNTGNCCNPNFNYFQFCLLYNNKSFNAEELLQLYNIGIKYKLDSNYVDDKGLNILDYVTSCLVLSEYRYQCNKMEKVYKGVSKTVDNYKKSSEYALQLLSMRIFKTFDTAESNFLKKVCELYGEKYTFPPADGDALEKEKEFYKELKEYDPSKEKNKTRVKKLN